MKLKNQSQLITALGSFVLMIGAFVAPSAKSIEILPNSPCTEIPELEAKLLELRSDPDKNKGLLSQSSELEKLKKTCQQNGAWLGGGCRIIAEKEYYGATPEETVRKYDKNISKERGGRIFVDDLQCWGNFGPRCFAPFSRYTSMSWFNYQTAYASQIVRMFTGSTEFEAHSKCLAFAEKHPDDRRAFEKLCLSSDVSCAPIQ